MNKNILAVPKAQFDKNVSNEYIKSKSDWVFVSILDEDNTEKKYDTSLPNFLQVKMWDIVEDLTSGDKHYKKVSDEELIRVVDFINANSDKSNFVVHCSAGISRSGAVARWIAEKFEVNSKDFYKNNPYIQPNLYILKRLKELDSYEIISSRTRSAW